jgi:Tfp pilus assembly protein PilO
MINFRDPKDQLPSGLAVVGICLIVATCVSSLFLRSESSAMLRSKSRNELAKISAETDKVKQEAKEVRALVEANRWSLKADEIQPVALESITKIAKAQKINVVSFRPQKVTESSSLRQLAFTLNIEGGFLSVANMINAIEQPGTKMAVNQVQFASKEGESDLVNASISLVTYLEKPKAKESSSVTKPAMTGKTPAPNSQNTTQNGKTITTQ